MNKSLALILTTPLVFSCVTNPTTGETEVDWPKVDLALDQVDADLEGISAIDEGFAEKLNELRALVAVVDSAVHLHVTEGAEIGTVDGSLAAAIALADELIQTTDPEDTDTLAVLVLIRSALGWIRFGVSE